MAEMNEKAGLCHVYLWLKGYGHIALQAEGGPYISFWPAQRDRKLLESVPSMTIQSLSAEIKKHGPPDKTFYASDMNIDKIRKWWDALTEKDPEWSLLVSNCSNIVYKALGEGSERFKHRVEGFTTTPKAVAELVEYDMKNQKAKIRLGSSCTPSSK